MGLVQGMENSVSPHMKFDKLNPYGLRKGAATHAVSGTTAAPSIPSIARRGEWSIGSVLDVYWHFGSVGDHYLGRILCGLDPNDTNFAVLPPHWILVDPLGNELVSKAMQMTYGPILAEYRHRSENPTGVLLRCLASIVFHSEKLLETMTRHSGHDFAKLTLLHDFSLLNDLKALVTVEPTPGVLVSPTGIPPHIGIAVQLSDVFDTLGELVRQFGEHGNNLMSAVEKALDGKAWENGHVTGSRLKEILDEYRRDSIEAVDRQLQVMRTEVRESIRCRGGNAAESEESDMNEEGFFGGVGDAGGGDQAGAGRNVTVYSYDGKFYAVPKGYQFPKANLLAGLRCWLKDQVVSVDGKEKVKAFRFFTATMLPDALSKNFRKNWLPIFKYLHPVLKEVPRNVAVTDEVVEKVYCECMVFLKEQVSYLWKGRSNPKEYSVGTWSNKTSYASIITYGTAEDKLLLKEPSNRNKVKRGVGGLPRKRTRTTLSSTKYPVRQQQNRQRRAAARMSGSEGIVDDGGERTFAMAFAESGGELTDGQERRWQEIVQEVAASDERNREEEEERQIREEGWASRPIPVLRNYGDISGFDRRQMVDRIGQVLDAAAPGSPRMTTIATQGAVTNGRAVGHCCITGCTFSMELVHRCHVCKEFVHMICAEPFNDLSEDERYCNRCIPKK